MADFNEYKGVWVFCEQRQGALMPTDFELVSEARKLADELGCEVTGLLLGDNVEGLAQELAGYGADKIIVCDQQLKLLHGENDGELDAQFHTLLAAATGNPVFVDIVSHLNELFSHNRADDVRLKRRMEEAINEHLMIIDALERKDADACSDAMARHLHAVAEKHFLAQSRERGSAC